MQMKALTIHQPWASLVALGLKKYETRSWNTAHRGPIAIHAAKSGVTLFQAVDCSSADFLALQLEMRRAYPGGEAPIGCIIATADVVDTFQTEAIRESLSSLEVAVGNYEDGRYAWRLANIRLLDHPLPASGKQGLWNIDIDL